MSAKPPHACPLSDEDITRIGAMLYRWTGMVFGQNKRYYIERRIAERMRIVGFLDPGAYLGFAVGNQGEREALINAFTINETYFYREEHQLAALSCEILPEIAMRRRPGDLIRIWSMPCASGEEAYSIAIWLLENWPMVDAYNIEIVGSDIDTAALTKAVEGHFSERSLARLPPAVRDSYFEPEHGQQRRIIEDLRRSVHFVPANIIDPVSMGKLGVFDVILCRNLLIYFDEAARIVAANQLLACLNPGGYLCLGHSRSMSRISDRFTTLRLADAIVYRRP
jgi:chemotaxis protein methyltransferase CheR